MMNHKVLILFFFLPALVLAENITVSVPGSVNISCNNASQCVAYQQNAAPVFFTALEINTSIPVNLAYTYERNQTVFVSNYTIVTQNVSVENCSIPPIVDQEALRASVTESLTASCNAACESVRASVADCQARIDTAQNERLVAINQEVQCRTELAAANNVSDARQESTTAVLNARIREAESAKQPWMFLAITISMIVLGLIAWVMWRARPPKHALGPDAAPPIGEGDD